MPILKTFCAGCAVLALFHANGCAEVTATDRVVAAGKLWAMAKYFHPALAYGDIDWDGAWVKAYPGLKSAADAQEYERAVKLMLDALNDPLTTTVQQHPPSQVRNGAITSKWETGSILTISVRDSDDWNSTVKQLTELSGEIPKARALVFDLRATRSWEFLRALINSGVERDVASRPLTAPGRRARLHSGLVPVGERFNGGYYSVFQVTEGRQIQPNSGSKDVPVVFVVDERSPIPEVALALQGAGTGWIFSEGSPNTEAYLATTTLVHLPYGIQVNLRTEELVNADGTIGINPDKIVLPAEGLKAALNTAANPAGSKRAERPRVRIYASQPADRDYPEPAYPGAAYRTLAALRIWGAYHYLYPYKELIGEDWEAILDKFLPKLEASRDAREYNLTVAEMVTHVHDSHAFVDSKVFREAVGAKAPDIRLRWIQNSPVVTRVDEATVKSAGIGVGDVVVNIGGEDVNTRIDFLSAHISASTPQALMRDVCDALLGGPDGSSVTMKLRKPDGRIYDATLTRRGGYFWDHPKERAGDIVKVLSGNIGYADLDRLSVAMVDEMFEKLKDTRAIIFDMRGFPLRTVWEIAPRLTEVQSPVAALFRQPVLTPPGMGPLGMDESLMYTGGQRLPPTSKWRYKHQTVMLIDERAQSQAEHTGLFFEAANQTKFIGSPTVGTDGDVTHFTVPGGIKVSMTGTDFRHADGRQLERIGLQPDILITPTIAGLAAGQDEVLERAVEYINTGR